MKRIGILTSGGDCQGINAAIRGVAKALYREFGNEVIIYGIQDGYSGLIYGNYKEMKEEEFSGILTRGGTILGTSRESLRRVRVANDIDKVKSMKANYKKLKLDCIIALGGNGTQKTANMLFEEGINIIGVPKTIDNDVWGTDITFGFHSAMEIATDVIDKIHTTATSHGRVFIVEIMGKTSGWLTLYAGIAGGAEAVLIPEIPYDIKYVAQKLERREKKGKMFSIIAVAEGAISAEEASMKKSEAKRLRESCGYPSVAYKIASDLSKLTDREIRIAVPGHYQRGGTPCGFDRVLATEFGTVAAKLVSQEKYGNMVAMQNGRIIPVPLKSVSGKVKTVWGNSEEVRSGREIGICFGDM